MTSSALLLSTYCGSILASKIISHYNKLSKLRFSLFEFALFTIIVLFLIAAYYDMGSGRFQYCQNFDINFGLKYFYSNIAGVRNSFKILFILVFLSLCIKSYFIKELRLIVLREIIFLSLITLAYILLVSKCGAKYYLVSGILLTYLMLFCYYLALLCKDSKIVILISSLAFAIYFFNSFVPYQERPRISYNFYKSYSNSWIKQAREAKGDITIFIPKDFPHYRWESWFFPTFSRTLYNYGILNKPINIKFAPQGEN